MHLQQRRRGDRHLEGTPNCVEYGSVDLTAQIQDGDYLLYAREDYGTGGRCLRYVDRSAA